ncbi:MAG: hypothetical protein AAGK04_09790 [Planctomycetota bacterium]
MRQETLTTAEYAWMLEMAGAPFAFGADNASLFPEAEASRERQLQSGLDALRARQLVTPDEQPDCERLDMALARLVDVVARPRLAIVTERREGGARKRIVHYLTHDTLVEYADLGEDAPDARRHDLRALPDVPAIVLALLVLAGAPERHEIAGARIAMNEPVFAKCKQLIDDGSPDKARPALTKLGLQSDAAQSAVDAIAAPEQAGTISIVEFQGPDIVDTRVMAFFAKGGPTWLARKPAAEGNELELLAVDRPTMWTLLLESLRSLAEPEPQA